MSDLANKDNRVTSMTIDTVKDTSEEFIRDHKAMSEGLNKAELRPYEVMYRIAYDFPHKSHILSIELLALNNLDAIMIANDFLKKPNKNIPSLSHLKSYAISDVVKLRTLSNDIEDHFNIIQIRNKNDIVYELEEPRPNEVY